MGAGAAPAPSHSAERTTFFKASAPLAKANEFTSSPIGNRSR